MSIAGSANRPFVAVLGLDLGDQESSGYAFDEAVRMVSRIRGSQLHVVHVVPLETSPEAAQEAAGLLQLYVSEKAAVLDLKGPQSAGLHVRKGDAGERIAQLAVDVGADAIIVGARRSSSLKRMLLGSTGERLMAIAACPVFVAGPRPRPQPSHIIVIEGPCPDCVERRFASQGGTWWCARHSVSHHLRRHHVFSYHTELPFSGHDSTVSPTGTD